MLGCDFDNIFKKGKQNIVANALSRKEEDTESLLCAISIPKSNWVEESRINWKQEEKVCKIIKKIYEDT